MNRELLIVDDNVPFRIRLSKSMEKKGFVVESFSNSEQTKRRIAEKKLEDGSGLELIKFINSKHSNTECLLLTGYGNIATAVAAIKSGAIDYLPKPAEIDQIFEALTTSKDSLPLPPDNPMTADRVRWEHIQRVFTQCNRNVSETARRLRMHRRTLQRILNKHAPKE